MSKELFDGWTVVQVFQYGFSWAGTIEGHKFWHSVREVFWPEVDLGDVPEPDNWFGDWDVQNTTKALKKIVTLLEGFQLSQLEALILEYIRLRLENPDIGPYNG